MTEDQPVQPNAGPVPETGEPSAPAAQASPAADQESRSAQTAPPATVAPASTSQEINYEDAFKKGAGVLMGAFCMAGSTGAFFLYNLIFNSSGRAPLDDIRFTAALAIAWLLVSVAALFLVRERYRWFDIVVAVVELSFAAALGVWSWNLHKEFAVLDSRYSVGLFNFDDSDSSAQLYNDVRDKLYELEKQHNEHFLLRPIPHNVTKQESTVEQNRGMSGWAKKYGSHLAVWVSVTKPAPDFRAELRIVPVQDLGKPVNSVFPLYTHHSIKLTSRDSAASEVLNEVLYFWGVAMYQQGKEDDASQILETLPGPNSAYYAAVCWYDDALSGHDFDGSLQRAEIDVGKAIDLNSERPIEVAGYHYLLGQIHYERLRTRVTRDPEGDFSAAVTELTTAAESYSKLNDSKRSARADVKLADAYYEHRYPPSNFSDLSKAKSLYEGAIRNLAGEVPGAVYASFSLTLSRLAAVDGQNKVSDCRSAEENGRLGLNATATSDPDRADVRSAVGAALGECAVLLADRSMLQRAFDLLDQSLAVQRPDLESMVMRERYGLIVLLFAQSVPQTPGDVLERGATRFREAALGFRGFQAHARSVDSMRNAAQCHMLQAQQSPDDAQESALNAAVQDLNDAVQFASEAGIGKTDLFKFRAKCYHQLAKLATDAAEKGRLETLARNDDTAAKEKATAEMRTGPAKKE